MSTLLQGRRQPLTAPGLRDRTAAQRAISPTPAKHQPAATVADGAVEAPRARWRVILGAVVEALREWRRRTVARGELANFDERMLRDIGVDPSLVDYEMRQSFWRPLRDWRY
jgi:uncharacterized protein YjiS (DUF1127 family)